MSQIKLPQDMVQYFSLFLVHKEDDSDLAGLCSYVAISRNYYYAELAFIFSGTQASRL
jgi:hypothetical protein